MSELMTLALVTLLVFGPIAGIFCAFWIKDFRIARQEQRRLAEGGEVMDQIPAGLNLRDDSSGLRGLRPDRLEPDRYTWTERRPNPAREPRDVKLGD